jgi:hypothetical protein
MNGRNKKRKALHDYALNFTDGEEVPQKIAFVQ